MNKLFLGLGLIVIATVVVLTFFNPSSKDSAQSPADLQWHVDLNSALQEAKTTNKSVFIDFYADWCSYCKELNQSTLSDSGVKKKLSQDYIAVEINTDKNPSLASKYKVYELPTLIILNSSGEEIKRHEGYLSANELLNWI